MKATWRAARAAVRRRRLQTLIIGVVVMVSTATIVLALGLLATVDGPYDKAFARLQGAHLNVSYDGDKVSADRLSATAHLPGVTASAGPFASVVVQDANVVGLRPGPITVVGRADQNGPVDRLVLAEGRWLTGPGEIVIRKDPHIHCRGSAACENVGKRIAIPGHSPLTIVGVVRSITQTADGWVTPAQAQALNPHSFQMLYRFADSSTGVSAVTADLPPGAVAGSQSYRIARLDATEGAKAAIPFLLTFGVLGLVAAVLIIGNVVSGAVVSGYRHIGVLKALGFTPAQVTGVYVVMIAVPGVIGCSFGVVIGNLLARFITSSMDEALDIPTATGVALWVDVVALAGVGALVAVTSLVPAVRAGRLSAAQAVSAGAAPRRGRALRVQRLLARTSLPRPVSLGLGLPFARPGRTALTLAAVAFGVAAVTFASGLVWSLNAFMAGQDRGDVAAISVDTAMSARIPPGMEGGPKPGPALSPAQAEARLRALPGTEQVTPAAVQPVHVIGINDATDMKAYPDGFARHGYDLARGRWLQNPAEIVVTGPFMKSSGMRLGDTVTVEFEGRRTALRIVGQAVGRDQIITDWATMSAIMPGLQPTYFEMALKKGVSLDAYVHSLHGALGESLAISMQNNGGIDVVLGLMMTLTLGLMVVSALGVFNTVVLNTRDRTRDFGILKSLGTTPRQVMAVVLTSMVALGLAGGLIGVAIGVVAHHVVMPKAAATGGITLPSAYLQVYGPLSLVLLASAGVVIGTLGALIPAGWASRLRTATALRSE
ncbi:ABC transporter permease [Actinomadura alba]|uniref:ABC transporter permease n=1 Tax=Actinomadura alba TaxID=406431 RepID=A0ABR7LN79_9ACTN|nr:ABC transporter permease [Actinomadura alba]MBC6466306.1 ABC transporter permease [Actinomadura alba]